jgi:hypothetical protein
MNRCISIALAALAVLSPLAHLCAEEDKEEAAQIAKEEEAAAKLDGESMDPLKNFSARGKFVLLPDGDERKTEDVIGQFATPQRVYLVKPMFPASREILKALNGKEVTLMGKLRAEGKYFIVEDSSGGGAKPVEKRSKRKL